MNIEKINAYFHHPWIPAFAGMTEKREKLGVNLSVIPAQAGNQTED